MSDFGGRFKIATRIQVIIVFVIIGIATIAGFGSNAMKKALFEQRGEQTRRLVETAATLINDYQARIDSGELTVDDAKKKALERIGKLRYDKTNYFWINDLNGTMLMHPTSPKLVGTDVRELTDAKGTHFFVGMIDVVKNEGSGLYQYYWPPDETAKLKISYVAGFPQWGWVIGSGVFVDDLEAEIWTIQKGFLMIGGVILLIAGGGYTPRRAECLAACRFLDRKNAGNRERESRHRSRYARSQG